MTLTAGIPDLQRHVGKFYGKYSAEVVDDNDPQKLGRIKVKAPAVFPDPMTVWARPCFSPGHFFVPPVGAKVWVEFEAGDTSYPLWVGTWYPTGAVPPEADKAPPTGRVIHTPAGHVVELQDKSGDEKVVVRHKLNSFVSIDKKGSILAANQKGSYLFLNADKAEVSLTSEQGHMVTLGAKGITVVHKGGARVEVADGKVKISGSSAVQLTGNQVAIAGGAVALGGNPPQFGALMASPQFDAWFMGHTHPTAVGPSGPAIPAGPSISVASKTVKVQL
jgi:hypothetical protein